MGITIDKWGPGAWNTLHAFAHTYPRTAEPARQAAMRELLRLFGEHLPCPKCRMHYAAYLEAHLADASLATRDALVAFLNSLHNDVNRRLGKRQYSLAEHYAVYRRPSLLLLPSSPSLPRVNANTIARTLALVGLTAGVVTTSMAHRRRHRRNSYPAPPLRCYRRSSAQTLRRRHRRR